MFPIKSPLPLLEVQYCASIGFDFKLLAKIMTLTSKNFNVNPGPECITRKGDDAVRVVLELKFEEKRFRAVDL